MRVAVVADLHANLPALRRGAGRCAGLGCDTIWCAGDVVGRGPHPNEVVEELRRWTCRRSRATGTRRSASDGSTPASSGPTRGRGGRTGVAGMDHPHTTEEQRSWLRQLPASQRFVVEGRSVLLFHGSPLAPERVPVGGASGAHLRPGRQRPGRRPVLLRAHPRGFHRVVGKGHFVAAGSVGCGLGRRCPWARYAVVYIGRARCRRRLLKHRLRPRHGGARPGGGGTLDRPAARPADLAPRSSRAARPGAGGARRRSRRPASGAGHPARQSPLSGLSPPVHTAAALSGSDAAATTSGRAR